MHVPIAHSHSASETNESEAIIARDRTWVTRIALGDVGAFEAMFDAYAVPLAALATSLTHSQDVAEEVVHDVFLAMWNSRTRLDVRHSLRNYVFQAVRNRVMSHLRHTQTERRLRLVGPEGEAALMQRRAPGGADDRIEEYEIAKLLERVLAELPARNREVFLMVRQQHLCYAEAAKSLGITVKAVEAHMSRALQALRVAISESRR
jgi:RNA polymerase sigma-70 factor, ECF subfamily